MLPLQHTIQFSDYSELYDLIIPEDNLLRRIKDLVDFSFIQKELMDKYCHDNGRMAESPVMMFKYLLLKTIYDMVSIYDNTLTNFANNTVQNKSFGRYFYITDNCFPKQLFSPELYSKNYKLW